MRRLLPIMLIVISLAGGTYLGYLRGSRGPVTRGPVLKVSFLDAEMGGAIVVRTPEGRFIVIDPGPERSANALSDYLVGVGARTVVLLVSNPSANRAGAAAKLVESFDVKELLRGEMTGWSSAWKRALETAGSKGVSISTLSAGNVIRLSRSTKLEVLGPPKGLIEGVKGSSDNNSLVVRIIFRGKRILLTSDIRQEAETSLVKSGRDLMGNVFVIPRGGQYGGTSLELLSMVRPEVCVVAADGGSRHPSKSVLERIDTENTGAAVYRTDERGTVNLITDGRSILVDTEHEPTF